MVKLFEEDIGQPGVGDGSQPGTAKDCADIPHICHGHKDGARGEKICHVEKFQISVHEG